MRGLRFTTRDPPPSSLLGRGGVTNSGAPAQISAKTGKSVVTRPRRRTRRLQQAEKTTGPWSGQRAWNEVQCCVSLTLTLASSVLRIYVRLSVLN